MFEKLGRLPLHLLLAVNGPKPSPAETLLHLAPCDIGVEPLEVGEERDVPFPVEKVLIFCQQIAAPFEMLA